MRGAGNLAEKIDTSPENTTPTGLSAVRTPEQKDRLDVVIHRKTVRRHIKDLVGVFALILFGVALYLMYQHASLADALSCTASGLVLLGLGYFTPRLMYPVWRAWMGLGRVLEVVFTIPIMAVLWVAVVVPTSIMARFRASQRLDMDFKRAVQSYWLTVDESHNNWKNLERQW